MTTTLDNMSNPATAVQAAAWKIQPSGSAHIPGNVMLPGNSSNDMESIIGQDNRIRVLPQDIVDGGKYRCK